MHGVRAQHGCKNIHKLAFIYACTVHEVPLDWPRFSGSSLGKLLGKVTREINMNMAFLVPIILFGALVIFATILGGKAVDILALRRANQK